MATVTRVTRNRPTSNRLKTRKTEESVTSSTSSNTSEESVSGSSTRYNKNRRKKDSHTYEIANYEDRSSELAEKMGAVFTQTTNPFIVNTDDAAELRAQQAYALRMQGKTYRAIAETCGYYDHAAAYKAIHKYAGTLQADTTVEEQRQTVTGILDELMSILMPMARGGDEGKPNLWAVDRVLATIAESNKLGGLYRVDPNQTLAQVLVRDITADLSQI